MKAFKKEHTYYVSNLFYDANSNSVGRFITGSKIFDILIYTHVLRI